MYNPLNLSYRSVIKQFVEKTGIVNKVYEIGKRHSDDLRSLIKFKSSKKIIDYVSFNKIGSTNISKSDLLISIDTLHLLSPSWQDKLENWLPNARYSIIICHMWTIGDSSIDFKEYGPEWYVKNLPCKSESYIQKWFANHNSYDKNTKKLIKDSYSVWQSGITETDFESLVKKLNCEIIEQYYLGFHDKPWIKTNAYLIYNEAI